MTIALFRSWGEIEFCRAFHPVRGKAVDKFWVLKLERPGETLFNKPFSANCCFSTRIGGQMPCVRLCKFATLPRRRLAQPRKLKILWLFLVFSAAVSAMGVLTMAENAARLLMLSSKRTGCAMIVSMCWRALSYVECWPSV